MKIKPSSKIGFWAFYLALAFIILVGLAPLLTFTLYADVVSVGDGLAFEFQHRPFLIVAGIGSILCGLSALVLGLIAIFKNKDRSILVLIASAFGLLTLFFLIGEIIGPE